MALIFWFEKILKIYLGKKQTKKNKKKNKKK